jgi:hypothetical protein
MRRVAVPIRMLNARSAKAVAGKAILITARTPIARPEPIRASRIKRATFLIVTAVDRRRLIEVRGRSAGRSDRGKADQRSGRDKCEKAVHLSFSFGGLGFSPSAQSTTPRRQPPRIYGGGVAPTGASNANVIIHCHITVMQNCPLRRQLGQNICCRLTKKRMSEMP